MNRFSKGTRGRGFQGSSDKNAIELQRVETQILLAGDLDLIEKGHSANRKNVKSADKVFSKQALESLTP